MGALVTLIEVHEVGFDLAGGARTATPLLVNVRHIEFVRPAREGCELSAGGYRILCTEAVTDVERLLLQAAKETGLGIYVSRRWWPKEQPDLHFKPQPIQSGAEGLPLPEDNDGA